MMKDDARILDRKFLENPTGLGVTKPTLMLANKYKKIISVLTIDVIIDQK